MTNFFEPKTIAVIGASDEKQKVGYSLMENLRNFKGNVIPINIKHDSVFGMKAYKSIFDYPHKIDLAVMAIPSPFVAHELEECGKKKISNVIVITAGFSEVGNYRDEDRLKEIAKKYHINLLGPNCFGICNPYANLDTTFALETPNAGDVAFISQSGALWSYISSFSLGKFGFSGFVSLGNMAGLDFPDFIDYFSKDKKTKSIVLYIEKINGGKKFIEACKKCRKPIYAIKVGISKEGSRAAVSHTGSLATDYEIYRGAFKQCGVILQDSLISCFEKAAGMEIPVKKRKIDFGKNAVIITNAGGAGAIMADYCSLKGVKLAEWQENNPWDLLGTALAKDYERALNKLKGKNFYDSVIVILTPQKMSEINKTAEVIANFHRETKKKIIACFLGGAGMEQAMSYFRENNMQHISTLKEAE